jgi:hypothetical protein
MSCRAKFTFIKGPCLNDDITHNFEKETTVLQMKQFLVQVHHVCDPSSSSLCFVWEEQIQKITDDNMTVASFGASVSITVSIIKKPSAFPPAVAPVAASAASSDGATSTSAPPPLLPPPLLPPPLLPPPETEVSRHSVHHAPSLPPTFSAAVVSGPSASASTSCSSNSEADSPESEAVAPGPYGPDIIVGSGKGLLEAKMQLELPAGSRNIKCYAGCSLLHLQSALVGANLMSALGQQLVKASAHHVQLPLDTPLASLNRSKLHVIECQSAASSANRAALSQQNSAPSACCEVQLRLQERVLDLSRHISCCCCCCGGGG